MTFKDMFFKSNLSVFDVLVLLSIGVGANAIFGAWGFLAAVPFGFLWGVVSYRIEKAMYPNV